LKWFAEQFHLAPWDVEQNITEKWWGWWQTYNEELRRHREKNKDG